MRPQRRLRGKTREKNSWKEHQRRMLGRRDEEITKGMKRKEKSEMTAKFLAWKNMAR